jgi:hypothetical protein
VPMQLFRAALVLQLCLVFVVAHRERAPSLRTTSLRTTRKLEDAALTLTKCISTFDSLRDGLTAAISNDVFTICPATHIVVEEEILVNSAASSVSVRCGSGENSAGSCTLSKGDRATGRILNFSGGGATLQGITFQGGSVENGQGGAVKISASGSGRSATFAPVAVRNCTFYDNMASSGGALFVEQHSCSIQIDNCIFQNNTATATGTAEGEGGGGGALAIHQTDMQCRLFCPSNLNSLEFYNNSAPDSSGGAIWARSRIPPQCASDITHDGSNTAGTSCPFMAIGEVAEFAGNSDLVCQESL